jgi:hypothetical protein
MRPRYSFSSRHTARARNPEKIRKQRHKYPDLLKKILDDSQIILEVLDARFIEETRNKEIEQEIEKRDKRIIYIINKSDLNPSLNPENTPVPNVIVSCKNREGIKNLRDQIKILAKNIPKNKGGKIMVGIIGYPNTGKSSLINILIGKNSAKTGHEPGFTKGIQKLKLSEEITLLDSPGVIPQKKYSSIDSHMMSVHAKLNARSYSKIRNPEEVISELIKEYPGLLEKYYGIESDGDSEIFLEALGKKLHFLLKKAEVDTDRTARIILRDWQEGKIRIN